MPLQQKELAIRFTYHSPKDGQPAKYLRLRDNGGTMAKIIDDECPDSREKDFALMQLEGAIFWANAAIARRS